MKRSIENNHDYISYLPDDVLNIICSYDSVFMRLIQLNTTYNAKIKELNNYAGYYPHVFDIKVEEMIKITSNSVNIVCNCIKNKNKYKYITEEKNLKKLFDVWVLNGKKIEFCDKLFQECIIKHNCDNKLCKEDYIKCDLYELLFKLILNICGEQIYFFIQKYYGKFKITYLLVKFVSAKQDKWYKIPYLFIDDNIPLFFTMNKTNVINMIEPSKRKTIFEKYKIYCELPMFIDIYDNSPKNLMFVESIKKSNSYKKIVDIYFELKQQITAFRRIFTYTLFEYALDKYNIDILKIFEEHYTSTLNIPYPNSSIEIYDSIIDYFLDENVNFNPNGKEFKTKDNEIICFQYIHNLFCYILSRTIKYYYESKTNIQNFMTNKLVNFLRIIFPNTNTYPFYTAVKQMTMCFNSFTKQPPEIYKFLQIEIAQILPFHIYANVIKKYYSKNPYLCSYGYISTLFRNQYTNMICVNIRKDIESGKLSIDNKNDRNYYIYLLCLDTDDIVGYFSEEIKTISCKEITNVLAMFNNKNVLVQLKNFFMIFDVDKLKTIFGNFTYKCLKKMLEKIDK